MHSLRRLRKAGDHHSNGPPTTQASESESPEELIRPHLLSLASIEKKYQEHLPNLLKDPTAAMERGHNNDEIEPEENAMWFAWHHGRPPPRHFPDMDPENVDEEKWKKFWMTDMERRE